jgi:hypothetical protein
MSTLKALQGQWYENRSTHDVFCVIAVDEDDGWIDVRDGYGDIDEFDFDEWESMDLVPVSAPETWRLVIDDLDAEDDDPGSAAPGPGNPPHHIKSSGTT